MPCVKKYKFKDSCWGYRIQKFYIYTTYKNEETLCFGANEKWTTFNSTMKAAGVFCDSMFTTNSMQQ